MEMFNPYYRDSSIQGRKIYVPLNFWFCKNPGLSLPLIALQYHDVYLKIELRPLIDLYTLIETDINNDKLGQRVKPNPLRQQQSIHNFFTSRKNWTIDELLETQLDDNISNTENIEIQPFQGWGLDPHLLINYHFKMIHKKTSTIFLIIFIILFTLTSLLIKKILLNLVSLIINSEKLEVFMLSKNIINYKIIIIYEIKIIIYE
jgi:hypothetical protein